jgi:hypothetical protein
MASAACSVICVSDREIALPVCGGNMLQFTKFGVLNLEPGDTVLQAHYFD